MKIILTLLLGLMTVISYGQKYKLKKDILYKDKKPVARIEGKFSLLKSNLIMYTMEGDLFLTVEGRYYSSELPGTEPIRWLNFSFPQLGKEMIVETHGYIGTKAFLKYELELKNIHIYTDGLHETELAVLEDYSEQLHADTMAIVDELRFFQKNLTGKQVERQVNAKVSFGTFKNADGIAILKGKNFSNEPYVIGKIRYQRIESTITGVAPVVDTIEIYKKLSEPITINGEKTWFLLAGYIDLTELMPNLFLFEEGKEVKKHYVDRLKQSQVIAKEAVRYMEMNGYL